MKASGKQAQSSTNFVEKERRWKETNQTHLVVASALIYLSSTVTVLYLLAQNDDTNQPHLWHAVYNQFILDK